MKAPRTVPNHAVGTEQIGARVQVWDNELDEALTGTVVSYDPEGWPQVVVNIDGSGPLICMEQGPFTDSGRFRIVAVLTKSYNPEEELRQQVQRVLSAIRDKGPQPQYHDRVMQEARSRWPHLWHALDALVAAQDQVRAQQERRAAVSRLGPPANA
jgi:hypothetical protein